MQTCLLMIMAASLVAIVYLLASGRLTGPQGPQGPQGERGPSSRPSGGTPLMSNKAQVVRKTGAGWEHEAWVRVGSPAWEKAYQTPGMALRREGEMTEGVQ